MKAKGFLDYWGQARAPTGPEVYAYVYRYAVFLSIKVKHCVIPFSREKVSSNVSLKFPMLHRSIEPNEREFLLPDGEIYSVLMVKSFV